jgi:hypothetical protein
MKHRFGAILIPLLLAALIAPIQHSALAHPTLVMHDRDATPAPASRLYLPMIAGGAASGAPPANPLAINIGVDATRAVSSTIDMEGGTLSATAADGTRFSLTLPPHALLSPEPITLTPISAVAGLPMSGGLVAGVQFGREGLLLLEPATLTITLTTPLLTTHQFVLASEEGGKETHLYPARRDPIVLTMDVMHFSELTLVSGTPQEAANLINQYPPSAPQARAEQAQAAQDEALAPLIPYPTLFDGSWHTSVKPALLSAIANADQLGRALHQFITWRKDVLRYSWGNQPPFTSYMQDGWQYLAQGIDHAVSDSYGRCVNNNDPTQAARIMFWVKYIGLIPALQRNLGVARLASMREQLRRCANFELDFDSALDLLVPSSNVAWRAHTHAQVPLQLDLQSGLLSGQARLDYVEFSFEVPPYCPHAQTSTQTAIFQIADGFIDLNLRKQALDPELVLIIDPGQTTETWDLCGTLTKTEHIWSDAFQQWHQEERNPLGEYSIAGWARGAGSIYAHKAYSRSGLAICATNGEICAEQTTLEIQHVPLR